MLRYFPFLTRDGNAQYGCIFILKQILSYGVSVVSEIMPRREVVTIDINNNPSVLDVAKLMTKHKIGSVVVVEGNKNNNPIGIITERDVIRKVSAQNKVADQVAVRDIMSSPLFIVKAIDSVDTAADTMSRNKIKRLIVLEEDGAMIGVLSVSDIAKKLAKIMTDDYGRYRSLRNMLDID
jgi:CBS domain-containing protein